MESAKVDSSDSSYLGSQPFFQKKNERVTRPVCVFGVIYTQMCEFVISLYAADNYWSSTEYSATNACNQNFNNGNQNNNKTNSNRVRAVRSYVI